MPRVHTIDGATDGRTCKRIYNKRNKCTYTICKKDGSRRWVIQPNPDCPRKKR